jgi:polyisoprenoid-binding protein YceI
MNRRTFTAFAAALLFTGTAAFAQSSTWVLDPAHSHADFQVRHMGISNVRGGITGIAGTFVWDDKDISKCSVNVTLDANTVNTNTARRDTDLKSPNFFNVAQYPTITFKSTSVTRTGDTLKITGDLTLAGVTKSITLDVDGPTPPQTSRNGKVITGLSATGALKRSDFNFGQKSPANAAIGDDIKFTIDAEAAKQ